MGPIVQIVIQAPNLARMFFGATGQICPMGHLKIQYGGHCFKMAAILLVKFFFENKMHLFGGFQ